MRGLSKRARAGKRPVRSAPVSNRPVSDRGAGARRAGVARILSKLGYASRTVSAELVRAGRVRVNGEVIHDPEYPVRVGQDQVSVDGRGVECAARQYVMFNKPRGLVTSAKDEQGRATVYDRLEAGGVWLSPVGRLDKASEGLLFFSNDTQWGARLLDPAHHLPRVYHVQIDGRVGESELAALRAGVPTESGELLRAEAVTELRAGDKTSWLEITLQQGRNRHIRRMLQGLGVEVLRLVRVAIGPISLGGLPKGQSRALTEEELKALEGALRP